MDSKNSTLKALVGKMKTRCEIKIGNTVVRKDEAEILIKAITTAMGRDNPKKLKLIVSRNTIFRVEEDQRCINFEEILLVGLLTLRRIKTNKNPTPKRKQLINMVASLINQKRCEARK